LSGESVLLGGLTWETLARDRRVRRLRRGKHFRGELRTVQREAAAAAEELGCAVRMVRDDFRRVAYLWIQFVDFQLPLGEPCPNCGGAEMTRTHEHYGRCTVCGAHLSFLPRVAPGEGAGGMALSKEAKQNRKRKRLLSQRVDQFTNVQLVFDPEESDEKQEVWYGRAEYEGEGVVLHVVYPLSEGARQPHPEDPEEQLHFIRYWALAPYARAVELGVDIPE
jgi:hypothetical protein